MNGIKRKCGRVWQQPGLYISLLLFLILRKVDHVSGQYYFEEEQHFVLEGESVDVTVFRGTGNTGMCTITATLTDNNGDFDSASHPYMFMNSNMDLQESGGMMAVLDTVAHEGIECFDFTLPAESGTCPPTYEIDDITTTSICIIDRTPWYYIEQSQYITTERTSLVVRIRRGGYLQHAADGTVEVTITADTATGGGTDYTEATPTTATFNQGDDSFDMTFMISEDDIKEDIETFTLTLGTPSNGALDTPTTATVFIFDESACVYIEKAEYTIGERGGMLTVRIKRRGYLWDTTTVTVGTTITDVTTSDGTDFTAPATGTATFTAGEEAYDMVFAIREDTLVEDTESFTIALTNPTRAIVSDPSSATVFIEDQTTWFNIEEATYVIGERSGTLTIRIHRGGYKDETAAVTVEINIASVTATSGSTSDFVGPSTTRASFAKDVDTYDMVFTINPDDIQEDLESFTVTLTNPTGGSIIEPSVATVIIIDESVWFYLDEPRTIVGERDGSMSVRVRKGGYRSATAMTSVDVSITDITATGSNGQGVGIDYTPTGVSTVRFPAGVDHVDMPFIVSSDEMAEDIEKFRVTLQNPIGGFIHPDEPSSTTIFIVDESAWLYIEEQSYIIGERDGTLTVRIRRGGFKGDTVSASLNIQDTSTKAGSDYVIPTVTSVTFAPGVSYQEVAFTILTDDVIEDKESFTISLASLTGAMLGVPSSTTVYILDQTAFIWIENSQYIVTEGDQVKLVFHRGGCIVSTETLTLTLSEGTATVNDDYSLPTDLTVTFEPGQTIASKSIPILRDNVREDLEEFVVGITLPSSASAVVLSSPITADIIIKDRSWYNLEAAEFTVKERASTVLVGIRRQGDLRESGSVEISIEDGSAVLNRDYSLVDTPTTISFASGLNIAHVPITIRQDDEYERNEMIKFVLTTPGPGEALGDLNQGYIVIMDDDEPERPGINWIVIIALSITVGLLLLGILTSCLCYARLYRRVRKSEKIIIAGANTKIINGKGSKAYVRELDLAHNSALENFTFSYPTAITY